MLRCMAAGCLSTAQPTRKHDFQHAVADMLCEVLEGLANDMCCQLHDATAAMERSQRQRSTCNDDVEKMVKAAGQSDGVVGAARRRFARDNEALERARRELDTAKAAQKSVDAKASEVKDLAEALEDVLKNHLTPFVDGSGGDLPRHAAAITALLDRVPI